MMRLMVEMALFVRCGAIDRHQNEDEQDGTENAQDRLKHRRKHEKRTCRFREAIP